MEKPPRGKTLMELGESVLFWSMELRKADKEVLGATEGTLSAMKRKRHNIKMKWAEAVDVLLGKMP